MDALNRCLVAIRLPDELRAALVDVQHQLRRRAGADGVRWTPSEELMLTMVMLGELAPHQIFRLQEEMGPYVARHRSLQLTLEGVGGHPTILQPRWVYASVGGDLDGLASLDAALETLLTPMLADHESRQMRARVPLGRLKQESEAIRSALGRALKMAGVGQIGSFVATGVDFIRIKPTMAGPVYETVQTYPFGG